jgi:hypothetical protein
MHVLIARDFPKCKDFWSDEELTLHEYHHVINQWGAQNMSVIEYGLNWKEKEGEAEGFASEKLSEYKECLNKQ